MKQTGISRRETLVRLAGTALLAGPALRVFAAEKKRLFKIGACDWSLGKRGQVAALEVAQQIGLDGVQVSFGPPGEELDLRKEEVRKQYLETSKRLGVEIGSLAMGCLNSVPYATEPETEKWVEECIEVMPKLGVKIVLLAFFGKGDIKDKPEAQKEVIERLKRAAPKAEKAGVILGIESTLNADEHLRILDAVGSPAVQVYYDVANMHYAGYDIYQEIRQLGAKRICEIHCKERGVLLGNGEIDFPKVKEAIDEIGWSGWLVIESAVGRGMSMKESYILNQRYLRSIFPTG